MNLRHPVFTFTCWLHWLVGRQVKEVNEHEWCQVECQIIGQIRSLLQKSPIKGTIFCKRDLVFFKWMSMSDVRWNVTMFLCYMTYDTNDCFACHKWLFHMPQIVMSCETLIWHKWLFQMTWLWHRNIVTCYVQWNSHLCHIDESCHPNEFCHVNESCHDVCVCVEASIRIRHIGWLRLVGSFKL